MAKQRLVSTSFWDDAWIQTLNPDAKLFYLYLLTNSLTNIAGIYKITIRRMIFDTGLNENEINNILDIFKNAGKAYLYKEYIIIPSWPCHQKIEEKNHIKNGIDKILKELPEDIFQFLHDIGYQYKYLQAPSSPLKPLASPLKPLASPLNYLNLNLNSNRNLEEKNKNSESPAAQPAKPVVSKKKLYPLKDDLANYYEELLTAEQPHETWSNYGKERKQLGIIAQKTRRLLPETPIATEKELAKEVVKTLKYFKRSSTQPYWRDKPITPATVSERWSQLITKLANRWQKRKDDKIFENMEVPYGEV